MNSISLRAVMLAFLVLPLLAMSQYRNTPDEAAAYMAKHLKTEMVSAFGKEMKSKDARIAQAQGVYEYFASGYMEGASKGTPLHKFTQRYAVRCLRIGLTTKERKACGKAIARRAAPVQSDIPESAYGCSVAKQNHRGSATQGAGGRARANGTKSYN